MYTNADYHFVNLELCTCELNGDDPCQFSSSHNSRVTAQTVAGHKVLQTIAELAPAFGTNCCINIYSRIGTHFCTKCHSFHCKECSIKLATDVY